MVRLRNRPPLYHGKYPRYPPNSKLSEFRKIVDVIEKKQSVASAGIPTVDLQCVAYFQNRLGYE
jgi:hypothetical protein